MVSFALAYSCAVVSTIVFAGTVFGLVVNNATSMVEKGDSQVTNNIGSLVSVAAIMQALWVSVSILVFYLIALGLIAVTDGVLRTVIKVIAALILVPLNVWLLVDGSIALSNVRKGDGLVMNNAIYGMTIMSGIMCLLTSVMFIGGLIYGIATKSTRIKAL